MGKDRTGQDKGKEGVEGERTLRRGLRLCLLRHGGRRVAGGVERESRREWWCVSAS